MRWRSALRRPRASDVLRQRRCRRKEGPAAGRFRRKPSCAKMGRACKCRSAPLGSILDARRAGRWHAQKAASTSGIGTTASIQGSMTSIFATTTDRTITRPVPSSRPSRLPVAATQPRVRRLRRPDARRVHRGQRRHLQRRGRAAAATPPVPRTGSHPTRVRRCPILQKEHPAPPHTSLRPCHDGCSRRDWRIGAARGSRTGTPGAWRDRDRAPGGHRRGRGGPKDDATHWRADDQRRRDGDVPRQTRRRSGASHRLGSHGMGRARRRHLRQRRRHDDARGVDGLVLTPGTRRTPRAHRVPRRLQREGRSPMPAMPWPTPRCPRATSGAATCRWCSSPCSGARPDKSLHIPRRPRQGARGPSRGSRALLINHGRHAPDGPSGPVVPRLGLLSRVLDRRAAPRTTRTACRSEATRNVSTATTGVRSAGGSATVCCGAARTDLPGGAAGPGRAPARPIR